MDKKYVNPKRRREKRLQGWFDPGDENDRYVLELARWFAETEKVSQKEFITRGALALGRDVNAPVPLPSNPDATARRIGMIYDMVREMSDLIKSGTLTASSSDDQERLRQFAESYDEMSEIERSVGQSYHVLDFEDDDDE